MTRSERWGERRVWLAETWLKRQMATGKTTGEWWVRRYLRDEVLATRAESISEMYPGQRVIYGQVWDKQLLGVQLGMFEQMSEEELAGLAHAHCCNNREIAAICAHRGAGAYVQLVAWALYRDQQLAATAKWERREVATECALDECGLRGELCTMLVWGVVGSGIGRRSSDAWAELVGTWGKMIDGWGIDQLTLARELVGAATAGDGALWAHEAHDLLCAVEALGQAAYVEVRS